MDELKNSVDFYAAMTDMWSSYGMTPYLGFTLHWIDDQWNLQNRCLGTKYVPEAHTADVKIRLKIWYFSILKQPICNPMATTITLNRYNTKDLRRINQNQYIYTCNCNINVLLNFGL